MSQEWCLYEVQYVPAPVIRVLSVRIVRKQRVVHKYSVSKVDKIIIYGEGKLKNKAD